MKLRMGIFFCEWANKVFIGFLFTGVDSTKELDCLCHRLHGKYWHTYTVLRMYILPPLLLKNKANPS
ncbi:unnamed protein product [Rhizophagus irregularis]|nr:unnamed protein product [Rhizophagus irregularis]